MRETAMGIPKNDGRRDARNPFTFMIEQVDESGAIIGEAIGGCNNVIGAQAMFRSLIPHYNEGDLIRIRQGGRIMSTINGTGEEHRKAIARICGTGPLLKPAKK